jgi:amidophosphoribosyltransferase
VAGNFNLVNTQELFSFVNQQEDSSIDNCESDLSAMLEVIHFFLKEAVEADPTQIQWVDILSKATNKFDGGFVVEGLCGNGDSFVLRDKHGIRPAYYYIDEETIAVASERPVLMTAFKTTIDHIKELPAGHALIVKADGSYTLERIMEETEKKACSFERIYFSRGSDAEIYNERKQLGRLLSEKVLKSINHDLRNTIFSFIPNTSETAYYGMIKGLESIYRQQIVSSLQNETNPDLTKLLVEDRIRAEKIIVKDVKLRTFITNDQSRNDLVSHVYDITYNSIEKHQDTICMLDDIGQICRI